MVVVFGKALCQVGKITPSMLSWWLAKGTGSISGRISGVGILPWWIDSLFYSHVLLNVTLSLRMSWQAQIQGVREWNVSFVRGFNDWEVVVVVKFFDFLYSIAEPKGGVDGLRWKLCKDGVFDSRSFYLALSSRPGVRFPWKSIWAAKAPPRVAFFIWITA